MAGRPKCTFSDEEVAEIGKLAYEGCQNNTIANITGIAKMTLVRHFGKFMTKKRCERKRWLRQCQDKQAENSAEMCKFLGKNELGQVDKQVTVSEPTEQGQTENERRAGVAAADAYKREMARQGAKSGT
jgi:hypothetical protein